MNSILDAGEQIKSALHITDEELKKYIADDLVKWFPTIHHAGKGYWPIVDVPGGVIAINGYVRYRHNSYGDELSLVRRERAAGRGNFHHILHELRAHPTTNQTKLAGMGLQNVFGHDVVFHPFMGRLFQMRVDMCVSFHHFVMQHVLKTKITPDTDAVFEIGMGIGDELTDLALRTPWPHIDFYGGEIALSGLQCLEEFKNMVGLKNIHGLDFDFTNPNVEFLRGKKKILVFCYGVLMYAKPFPERLFLELFDIAEDVTAVICEPFSFGLTKRLGNTPIFDRARAKAYGFCEEFWEGIESLETSGKIVIDEIIPDFTGKALISSGSLVVFRKKRD